MKTLLFLATLTVCTTSIAETLFGTARGEKGQIVYTESHTIERRSDGLASTIVTDYKDASQKLFARMTANFKNNPHVPDLVFEDFRFERKYEGKHTPPNSYTVTEFKGATIVKTSNFKLTDNYISGPGFDNFILNKFVNAKADVPSVQFLVVPRHDHYTFLVNKIDGDTKKVYTIRPSSLLVRLFVSKIKITYDAKDHRLLRYEGLSNLPTNSDDPQTVVIEYSVNKS